MQKFVAVLSTTLLWMASNVGSAEQDVKEVESPRAREASERTLPPSRGSITGKVTQTMDVAQYTYVEVDTGQGLIWAAGPLTPVKVGDSVELLNPISMTNFSSSALNRIFDEIHLASAIRVNSP